MDTRCPRCGGSKVRRRGKNGEFVGCKEWPRCTWVQKGGSVRPNDEDLHSRRGAAQVVTSDYMSAFRHVVDSARSTLVASSMNIEASGPVLDHLVAAATRVEGTEIFLAASAAERFGSERAMADALIPAEVYVPVDPTRLHHAKFVATERLALIGSANLTTTGMGANFEVGVILRGREVQQLLRAWGDISGHFRRVR